MIDFDREKGRVSIRGVPYLLIQPTTLLGFQKAAEASGAAAGEWLAAGGRAGGRRSSQRLSELSQKQGREFAQDYLSMGREIGWGVFEVTRFEGRTFEVVVAGSPFAEGYGASSGPVCCFIRGVIAGLGDTLFGEAECEEVECAAAGALRCRFVCRDRIHA